MNGITIIIIALIVVIAVGGFFLMDFQEGKKVTKQGNNIIRSGTSPTPTPTPAGIATPTPTQSPTQTPNPQTYNVDIRNFAFSPSTLTINRGDRVVWINRDSARHTITSNSGNELDSQLLPQGESYSHTFNTAGTYNYHCTPHPYMKAKIIVR